MLSWEDVLIGVGASSDTPYRPFLLNWAAPSSRQLWPKA
jgi:N-acetylmuramic acid 6-phosphate (MurNAc-6-P) etherase